MTMVDGMPRAYSIVSKFTESIWPPGRKHTPMELPDSLQSETDPKESGSQESHLWVYRPHSHILLLVI